MKQNRRNFLQTALASMAGVAITPALYASTAPKTNYKISLAEWSFHKALFKKEMTNLDFPVLTRELGIDGVEYVNQFFKDKAKDQSYLAELKKICKNEGVENVLIMCDGEGTMGAPDKSERIQTVENHKKWVDAAAFLGCHAIRVNAGSRGTFEEQQKLAADGLRRLCEYADKQRINVIVENHGGLSSNGKWLSGVMDLVDHKRVGTLPDFGNFMIDRKNKVEYDRYKGMKELMPYAKGVSAKSNDFNAQGEHTTFDFHRIMKIVKQADYKGFIGIEYEGQKLSEREGVLATKRLLEEIFAEL